MKNKLLCVVLAGFLLLSGCGKDKEMPMENTGISPQPLVLELGETTTIDLPLPVDDAEAAVSGSSEGLTVDYAPPSLTVTGDSAGEKSFTITYTAKGYLEGILNVAVTVNEPKKTEKKGPRAPGKLAFALVSEMLGVNSNPSSQATTFSLKEGTMGQLTVYPNRDGAQITAASSDPLLEAAVDGNTITINALGGCTANLTITVTADGETVTNECTVTVNPIIVVDHNDIPAASGNPVVITPPTDANAQPEPEPEPEPAPVPVSQNYPESLPFAYLAEEILSAVNDERADMGLPALRQVSAMSRAAALRAKETATSQSHTRPDGSECHSVFAEFGLGPYAATGENLAGANYEESGRDIVNRWMESPGHREAILFESFACTGVGIYYDGETYRYCQLFSS